MRCATQRKCLFWIVSINFLGRRKKSAPALLMQHLPPLPPRTRDALILDGKNSHSCEDITNTFASISESTVRTPTTKGHRRNLSGDLHYRRQDPASDSANDSAAYSTVNITGKKSFEKKHRRMKSHETISTVFSPSPKGSKTDLTNIENDDRSVQSGKSSAASSSGDSPAVSKEGQNSGDHQTYFIQTQLELCWLFRCATGIRLGSLIKFGMWRGHYSRSVCSNVSTNTLTYIVPQSFQRLQLI